MGPNVLRHGPDERDGRLFAHKPYIGAPTTSLKMGDFKTRPWCETWDGSTGLHLTTTATLFRCPNLPPSRIDW